MSYVAEPLGEHHELTSFDCGNQDLNEWLARHAATGTGQDTRTYVLVTEDEDSRVLGYFAIAPHTINREQLSKSQGRRAPRQIPAVLLAKLALDRQLQGQGLGGELLVVALRTIVDAARRVGGRFVLVDAIDEEAQRFYEHHDFVAVPENPNRLARKLSAIASALGLPWP